MPCERQSFFRRSLNRIISDTTWLIHALCLAVIVWIWIMTVRGIQQEYDVELAHIQQQHADLALAFEEHVRRTVADVDEVLLFMKTAYESGNRTNDKMAAYLQWGRTSPVLVGQISIADETGHYVVSAINAPTMNIADRNYFRVHAAKKIGGVYIDAPVIGRLTGKRSVYMSRRIDKPDGSFGGVVSAAVDPLYFSSFYKQMNLGGAYNVTIIGRDGIVRMNYMWEDSTAKQVGSFQPLLAAAALHPVGMLELGGNQSAATSLQFYRVVPEYSLIVDVGVNKAVALADFERRKQRWLAETTIFTVVILLLYGTLLRAIRRQRLSAQQMELQQAHLAAIFDNIPHMVWLQDVEGRYLAVNQPFVAALGLTKEQVTGKTSGEVLPAEFAHCEEEDKELIATGQRGVVQAFKSLNNKSIWLEVYRSPVLGLNGDVLGLTGLALDISERKLHEGEIYRMGNIDSLTGLYNRHYVKERLSSELDQRRESNVVGALLFIDLDDLKTINDTFGHTFGDQVIQHAGECISSLVGEQCVVARVGGDSFIVLLLGEGDREKVRRMAERICQAMNVSHEIEGTRTLASASIGIAMYPADGDTVEELFKNFDTALYVAKDSGKNTWCFYDAAVQQTARENMLLKLSLAGAMERQEFALHYQPFITLHTRKVIGFEALLRWNNPEHGSVPPSRFIPLAEQSGLISMIGRWVFQEACRFARKLADLGRDDLHVAVNISPRQLHAADFVQYVAGTIAASGIKPYQIEFEITENVLMDSIEAGTFKLEQLREIGVHLSLDDFGTGYSSLTYLRSLPVTTLKIDKSFIDKVLLSHDQVSFINSIVSMAHVLRLTVVAEGVENEQQLERLLLSNCDCIQGYVFSQPIPETEAIEFLRREL